MHALGIGGELAQRFDIGREPSQTMGGALLAIEQRIDHMAIHADAPAHRFRRLGQHALGRLGRRARERDELYPGIAALSVVQHLDSPCALLPSPACGEG